MGVFLSLLPVIVSTVAPYITELVKKGVNALAGKTVKLPAPLKVGVNAAAAAAAAGVCGSVLGHEHVADVVALGSLVGLGSSAGFAVGKKS